MRNSNQQLKQQQQQQQQQLQQQQLQQTDPFCPSINTNSYVRVSIYLCVCDFFLRV